MIFARKMRGRRGDTAVGAVGESAMGPSGTESTESDLITRIRAGDPAAMAGLYERHRGAGLKFARSLVSHFEDAEDVLQEAFTKAVSAIRNGYGPKENFAPYLITTVRSVANTLLKKRAIERPAPSEELDPVAVEDPALDTVLSVFEHDRISAAMQTLPARWRAVLWHAEVAGLRPREIAPMLGIEANAVSSLLIRARTGLRAAYELQTQETTAPALEGACNP